MSQKCLLERAASTWKLVISNTLSRAELPIDRELVTYYFQQDESRLVFPQDPMTTCFPQDQVQLQRCSQGHGQLHSEKHSIQVKECLPYGISIRNGPCSQGVYSVLWVCDINTEIIRKQ